MFSGNYMDGPGMGFGRHGMLPPGAGRRFDEYYRCYPIVMMPGPDRENLNYGGKVILPPSALDKLTRLHITYPMLFELTNRKIKKTTHAGVLEFIAEEGKIYLPQWLMQTLLLEPGDLLQIKSTDLPPGSFIKLQPQNTAFLDISDPKAVLENALRNFSTLTKDDIFSFSYNDQIFEIAVLEVKPDDGVNHAISVLEVDLEVDFAAPVGYVEPPRSTGSGASSKAGSVVDGGIPSKSGPIHTQGSMAQAINYTSIAPSAAAAAAGEKAAASAFLGGGQKLNSRKSSRTASPLPGAASSSTPRSSTPLTNVINASSIPSGKTRLRNGPQPLRLPPGKLFFGYEYTPPKSKDGESTEENKTPQFQGSGQSLRGNGKRKAEAKPEEPSPAPKEEKKEKNEGQRLGGRPR